MESIDTEKYVYPNNKLLAAFQHRLNFGLGIFKLNQFFLKKTIDFKPDLIWFDNRIHIRPKALKSVAANIKKINVLTDDPFGKHPMGWQIFKKSISFLDFHFVQRAENEHDLYARGAKNVVICYRSFDAKMHRPIELSASDKQKFGCEVGFIGSHAPHRAEVIAWLIDQGINVAIYGNGWRNNSFWEKIAPFFRSEGIFYDEYVKAICGMDVALHFLRKENRDTQDSRTFEIPACGTFMLAERSTVHEGLFAENQEAVFFDSKVELLEKIQFYLKNPLFRQQIAAAGRFRVIQSGYDHESRIKQILNIVSAK
jgi:spore maturation protein CgeB